MSTREDKFRQMRVRKKKKKNKNNNKNISVRCGIRTHAHYGDNLKQNAS
jgi:hypothetical protein